MSENERAPRVSVWLRGLLVVSLAANLLVVGAVGGFLLSGGAARLAVPDQRDLTLLYARALDEGDRRALRRALFRKLGQGARDRQAPLEDFRNVLRILRAEPLDKDALSQALAQQGRHNAERERIGEELLLDRIARMSAEDRAAYADRLEEGVARLSERVRKRRRPAGN